MLNFAPICRGVIVKTQNIFSSVTLDSTILGFGEISFVTVPVCEAYEMLSKSQYMKANESYKLSI